MLELMIGVAVLVGMIAWQVRAIIRGRGPAITLAGLVGTFTFAFSVLRLRPSAAPALRGIPEILARASAVSAVTSLDGRLGAVGRRGVGFLEIFIGNLVRLGGSTQLGQPGHDSDRFVGRRQDTDGGLAVAQLCGDAVTVRLVQAEPFVVKCAEGAAANDSCSEADRSEQRQS